MAMTTDEIAEKCAELKAFMAERGLSDPNVTIRYTSYETWALFTYDANKTCDEIYDHTTPERVFSMAFASVAYKTSPSPNTEPTQDEYGDMNERAEKLAEKWESDQ